MMAAVPDQIKASSLINNLLKSKNVAKKSTSKLPRSHESSRSASPSSKPASRSPSRESSPEKKAVLINGLNKHVELAQPAAQGDVKTTSSNEEGYRNLKRDLNEGGGGDNPAKQARMQIENIEKAQEVMLKTASGKQSPVSAEDPDCTTKAAENINKVVSNGTSSNHIQSDAVDKSETDSCDKAHSDLEAKTTADNVEDAVPKDEVDTGTSPSKALKPSFTLGDKAKDTFKEILKAAVSRVSSEISDKSLKSPEKITGTNNSVKPSSTPTKSVASDKGNLFENMSIDFSSKETEASADSEVLGSNAKTELSGSDLVCQGPAEPHAVVSGLTASYLTNQEEKLENGSLSGCTTKVAATEDKEPAVSATLTEDTITSNKIDKTCDDTGPQRKKNDDAAKSINPQEKSLCEYHVGARLDAPNSVEPKDESALEEKYTDGDNCKDLEDKEGKKDDNATEERDEESLLLGSVDSDENCDVVDDSILDEEPRTDQGDAEPAETGQSITGPSEPTETECNDKLTERQDNSKDEMEVLEEKPFDSTSVPTEAKSVLPSKTVEELETLDDCKSLDESNSKDESKPKDESTPEDESKPKDESKSKDEFKPTDESKTVDESKSGATSKSVHELNSKGDCESLAKSKSSEESTTKVAVTSETDEKGQKNFVSMVVEESDVESKTVSCESRIDVDCEIERLRKDGDDSALVVDEAPVSVDSAGIIDDDQNSAGIMEVSDDAKDTIKEESLHNEIKSIEEESNKRKLSQSSVDDNISSKKVKIEISVGKSEESERLPKGTIDSSVKESGIVDLEEDITDIKDITLEKSSDKNDILIKLDVDEKQNKTDSVSELLDSEPNVKVKADENHMDVNDNDSASGNDDDVLIMDEDSPTTSFSKNKQEEKPLQLESGPDGMLKISRKALERLICQKMEKLLASSEHIKMVSDLQNRISKLTLQLNKWKTAAKSYQVQIVEVTRSARPERRRAARGQVRHVCIQVDEARIQAGQLPPSPAKSGPHKTPPRQQTQNQASSSSLAPKPQTTSIAAPVGQAGQTIMVPVAGASANGTMTILAPSNLPPASANLASGQYRYATIAQQQQGVKPMATVREILDTRRTSDTSEKSNGKPAASPIQEKFIDLTEDDDASPNKPGSTGGAMPTGQVVVRQGIPIQNTAATSTANNQNVRSGTYLVPVTNGQPILLQQMVGQQMRPPVVYSTAQRPGGAATQQVILQSTASQPASQQLVTLATGQTAIRPLVMATTTTVNATKPTVSTRTQAARSNPATQTLAASRGIQPRGKHPAPLPPQPVTTKLSPDLRAMAPKPSLKISRVPQGIVLSWNMSLSDSHADITNYQLFAYQESSALPLASLWKRVGDVKALPLPMACTLTQFHEGNKYHFAVRAVDQHGRIGPFSEPSSIHLEAKS